METITNFNTQLMDFFNFLLKYCECPKLKEDLIYYSGLVKAAIKLDKQSAIDQYIIHVLKYEQQINSRQESFFMEDLTVNDVDILKELNDEQYILKVMDVKEILKTVDDTKKNKIFDYLIVITFYARQFYNQTYVK